MVIVMRLKMAMTTEVKKKKMMMMDDDGEPLGLAQLVLDLGMGCHGPLKVTYTFRSAAWAVLQTLLGGLANSTIYCESHSRRPMAYVVRDLVSDTSRSALATAAARLLQRDLQASKLRLASAWGNQHEEER